MAELVLFLLVLFMGWFGPRGLASVVLGLVVVEEASQVVDRAFMAPVLVATVLLSVLAHGITAAPFSEAFARSLDPSDSDEQR